MMSEVTRLYPNMSQVCPIVVSINLSLRLEVQLALVVDSLFIVAPIVCRGFEGGGLCLVLVLLCSMECLFVSSKRTSKSKYV